MDIEVVDTEIIWDLRLALGDLYDIESGESPRLTDEHYQSIINNSKNKDGVLQKRKALVACAMAILAQLAQQGARQRIFQEEIYGKELVDSWIAFLKMLQNGKYSGVSPVVYFGGVMRDRTAFYATNPEFVDSTFYMGQQDRTPNWKYQRKITPNNVIEQTENKNRYFC